jgi:hypothetical protein
VAAAQATAAAATSATTAPLKVGDMATVTLRYRESPTRASTGKTSVGARPANTSYEAADGTGQALRAAGRGRRVRTIENASAGPNSRVTSR